MNELPDYSLPSITVPAGCVLVSGWRSDLYFDIFVLILTGGNVCSGSLCILTTCKCMCITEVRLSVDCFVHYS